MDIPVLNKSGASAGSLTIDPEALGGEINPALIKQAYVRYHANRRQGSARNRGRGEISGTTAKWYKQKGTGRARHGAKTSNIFRGGGRAFAKRKTREDYRQDMPKKMRRKANRNALLAKLVDSEVKVIDKLVPSSPKTREFTAFLSSLGIDRRTLVALSADEERSRNARLSARNIDDVSLCRADQLNCFEMLNHRYLVIGREELEAWLSGPSSQTDKRAKLDPMGAPEKREKTARPKRGSASRKAGG